MVNFEFEVGHLENGVWIPKKLDIDGRVDIKFSVKNNTDDIITCVEPKFFPLDKDCRLIFCKFYHYHERMMKINRRIYPHQMYSSYFENMWYNKNIVKVFLLYLYVTFLSGHRYSSDKEQMFEINE